MIDGEVAVLRMAHGRSTHGARTAGEEPRARVRPARRRSAGATIARFRARVRAAKPLVAAVNGHAIAGGCVLAACADVVLMAEGTGRIGVPEIRVGVPFPRIALEVLAARRRRVGGPRAGLGAQTYLPERGRSGRAGARGRPGGRLAAGSRGGGAGADVPPDSRQHQAPAPARRTGAAPIATPTRTSPWRSCGSGTSPMDGVAGYLASSLAEGDGALTGARASSGPTVGCDRGDRDARVIAGSERRDHRVDVAGQRLPGRRRSGVACASCACPR